MKHLFLLSLLLLPQPHASHLHGQTHHLLGVGEPASRVKKGNMLQCEVDVLLVFCHPKTGKMHCWDWSRGQKAAVQGPHLCDTTVFALSLYGMWLDEARYIRACSGVSPSCLSSDRGPTSGKGLW